MLGLSAQKANGLLEKSGLQESFRDAKNKKCWKPTEKGRAFAVLTDTNKKHSDGLMEDLVAIIYSFSARMYGIRRAKRKTEKIVEELKDKD